MLSNKQRSQTTVASASFLVRISRDIYSLEQTTDSSSRYLAYREQTNLPPSNISRNMCCVQFTTTRLGEVRAINYVCPSVSRTLFALPRNKCCCNSFICCITKSHVFYFSYLQQKTLQSCC